MVPLLIALYIQEHNKETLINECQRFTIGYGMTLSGNGKSLKYPYVVKGHTYTGTWGQKPRSWSDYWQSSFVAKNFLYERSTVSNLKLTGSIGATQFQILLQQLLTKDDQSYPKNFRKLSLQINIRPLIQQE